MLGAAFETVWNGCLDFGFKYSFKTAYLHLSCKFNLAVFTSVCTSRWLCAVITCFCLWHYKYFYYYLQVQKKNYREEKKRATKELLSTITDPSVIVMADWLKVRI